MLNWSLKDRSPIRWTSDKIPSNFFLLCNVEGCSIDCERNFFRKFSWKLFFSRIGRFIVDGHISYFMGVWNEDSLVLLLWRRTCWWRGLRLLLLLQLLSFSNCVVLPV